MNKLVEKLYQTLLLHINMLKMNLGHNDSAPNFGNIKNGELCVEDLFNTAKS